MLYSIQCNTLTINDVFRGRVHRFDLTKFRFRHEIQILHAALSPEYDAVAVAFELSDFEGIRRTKLYAEGILLCDLTTDTVTWVYDYTCLEAVFSRINTQMLYMARFGAIASLSLADGTETEIYHFARNMHNPEGLRPSADGKYLLYMRYSSGRYVLHLSSLQDRHEDIVIGASYHQSYDFLNDSQVIHSHARGLKVFDIIEQKNTLVLRNGQAIVKKYRENPYINQVRQALDITPSDRIITDQISSPLVSCGRVYFELFILSWQQELSCWCSVDTSLKDFRIYPTVGEKQLYTKLYVYGDTSRQVLVYHYCSSEADVRRRSWRCRVMDGNKTYVLENCTPIEAS